MAQQDTLHTTTAAPPRSPELAAATMGDLHRALKATGFYPRQHPTRAQTLSQAHGSLLRLLDGRDVALVITRSGFSDQEGGLGIAPAPFVSALARELFVRRIRRLTILPDLTPEDLRSFLFLLSLPLQKIESSGGIERLMTDHGIRTIWTNEIDMAAILSKRDAMEQADQPFTDAEDDPSLLGAGEEVGEPSSLLDDLGLEVPEETATIPQLLARLEQEPNDSRFMELAKELAGKANDAKRAQRFSELLPVLTSLQTQSRDDLRGRFIQDYALFTFEQVASGTMTDFILKSLQSRDYQDKETIIGIIPSMGQTVVYAVIQQLCVAEDLFARKLLATALIRMGEQAIPPICAMLQDDRWYVVRNMVAIMGEIGSPSCLGAMHSPVSHADERVRKETVRALSRIKGQEAEALIISLLHDKSLEIRKQAIHSLGIMKAPSAVGPLLQIIHRSDLFRRQTPLKKEAIASLGRIADRQALQELLKIVSTPSLFFWRAPEELKVAAAAALGAMGDEGAIPLLTKRAAAGGRVGAACREALETLERIA